MRPSTAPQGPLLSADLVAQFARTHLGRPHTHRTALASNASSYDQPTPALASGQTSTNTSQVRAASGLGAPGTLLPHQQYRSRQLASESWMGGGGEEDEEEGDELEDAPEEGDGGHAQYNDDEEDGADEESHFETHDLSRAPNHDDGDGEDDEGDHNSAEEHDSAGEQQDTVDEGEQRSTEHESEGSDDEDVSSGRGQKSDRVKVAVRCRPLMASEQTVGVGSRGIAGAAALGRSCVHIQGNDVLLAKSRLFTFDHAFSPDHSQQQIYEACGAPMVQAAWKGYHATILAYGQTGSGKTFTMGSGGATSVSEADLGIIPRVVNDIYARVRAASAKGVTVITRVSYLEIYQEELKDLLHPTGKGSASAAAITIREEASGGVVLTGVREEEVRNFGDMMRQLARGSISRTTGSTRMNEHSSRSHSIFTITIEQRRPQTASKANQRRTEVVRSKFHLVDLAGSERAKKTGAVGVRFQESVNINRGLLALGNVIQALSVSAASGAPRHVPYRASKLTRLLQGSLGGSAVTLMIACVSPSDASFEETHTTLKYAYRARSIRNKAVVNRKEEVLAVPPPMEPTANVQAALAAVAAAKDADIGRMQEEIDRLQSRLNSSRTRDLSHRSEDQSDTDAETDGESDGTLVSDDPALRGRHASLAHNYQSLHGLFQSLQAEHAWLLSGLVFFIRNLSELYALERRRDEVKEKVISLRREYDSLASDTSNPTSVERVRTLSVEIKEAQKAYVTFRDLLLRLREDLEGFLDIYTREKMEELQKKQWTDDLPQVDVADEIRVANRPLTQRDHADPSAAWQNGLNGDGAEAARVAAELASAQESLTTLQAEHSNLAAAHALAQEDLKYDDEIFEEKVRTIKELTSRDKTQQEQLAQLKEANKQLAEMMRQMGNEIVQKLANGGGSTARSVAPNSARGQPVPLSARLMEQLQASLALGGSPLKSARLGEDGSGSHNAPEYFRAATSHLAREREDHDEMMLAHDLDATEFGTTPARSRPSSRPATAQPSASKTRQLRSQHATLVARIETLRAAHTDLAESVEGLRAHMGSRKAAHIPTQRGLEKQLRDLRIQLHMKHTELQEQEQAALDADAHALNVSNVGTQRLREAEQLYQSLEQELSLKQRLLSALSPRAVAKTESQANVRRSIESEVRDLEQALKQAGLALETLQLGASGPRAPGASVVARLASEVRALEEAEAEIQAQATQAQQEYASQHADDKDTFVRMNEELQGLEEDILDAQAQLENLQRQMQDEEDEQQHEHMHIEITPASATKVRPSSTLNSPKASRAAASLPTSPAQLQSLKRKTQWLEHQVSAHLAERAALEQLAAQQQEQAQLAQAKREVEAAKNHLLEKSMRASGARSMKDLIAVSRPTTAGGSTTAALNQSLQVVNSRLSHLDAKSHSLMRQSQSLAQMSARRTGGGSGAAEAHALNALQGELAELHHQRGDLESQRQRILAQLDGATNASTSIGDADIVDAAMLSEADRAELAQLDETLDDMELQMEFKAERIAEMQQGQAAANGAMSHRGAKPSAAPAHRTEPEVDLLHHRDGFLEKAQAMFDPHDANESAFVAREFVALALERSAASAEAARTQQQLQTALEEKEAHLARLESQVAAVMEENEARVARLEQEWSEKLRQAQAHQAPLRNHSISPNATLPSSSSTSTSPVLQLKKLKMHMQARLSQQGLDAATSSANSSIHGSMTHEPERHFGPARTYTPADLPLSVHTPLLYNQSPSATPRSSDGYNHLSPSRGSTHSSQRSSIGNTATLHAHSASSSTVGAGAIYTPQLSPSTLRLRSQPPSFFTSDDGPSSVGSSGFVSGTNSGATSAAGSPAKHRAQLSLLKRKQFLRSSVTHGGSGSGTATPDQQDELDEHEADFTHSTNFLSARPGHLTAAAPRTHQGAPLTKAQVPQLNLGQMSSGSGVGSLPSSPQGLSSSAAARALALARPPPAAVPAPAPAPAPHAYTAATGPASRATGIPRPRYI